MTYSLRFDNIIKYKDKEKKKKERNVFIYYNIFYTIFPKYNINFIKKVKFQKKLIKVSLLKRK